MPATRHVAETMAPEAIPYTHKSFTYSRCEPDHCGWTEFEVYRAADGWHWTAVDDDGCHRGFASGAHATDEEARQAGEAGDDR